MTCRQRIARIRIIEKMEKMNQNNNRVIKSEDGTMKYLDNNGDVMFEAKMINKNEG